MIYLKEIAYQFTNSCLILSIHSNIKKGLYFSFVMKFLDCKIEIFSCWIIVRSSLFIVLCSLVTLIASPGNSLLTEVWNFYIKYHRFIHTFLNQSIIFLVLFHCCRCKVFVNCLFLFSMIAFDNHSASFVSFICFISE